MEPTQISLLSVEQKTELLYERLLSSQAALASRYGADYPLAQRADQAARTFAHASSSAKTRTWWEVQNREMSAVLDAIKRSCVFLQPSLNALLRSIDAISQWAQRDVPNNTSATESLKRSYNVMTQFKIAAEMNMLEQDVVRASNSLECFSRVRRAVAALDAIATDSNQAEIAHALNEGSAQLENAACALFDVFFGTGRASGLLLAREQAIRPFGRFYLDAVEENLARLIDHSKRAVGKDAPIVSLFRRAWSAFKVVEEAINAGMVPQTLLMSRARPADKLREMFVLPQRINNAHSIEDATPLAEKLENTATELFISLLTHEPVWALSRFNAFLSEISPSAERNRA